MIYKEHIRPGDLVVRLALDSAKPLYASIGFATPANVEAASKHVKDAMASFDWPRFCFQTWEPFCRFIRSTMDEQTGARLIAWLEAAFTGEHEANPNLSEWIEILSRFGHPNVGWPPERFSSPELRDIRDFSDLFLKEQDFRGFQGRCDEARDAFPASDWDARIIKHFGFNVFDEDAGNDPFIKLSFVNQGQALRRAIKAYDFEAHPGFPHQKLTAFGREWVDEHDIWMPDGAPLGSLLEVV